MSKLSKKLSEDQIKRNLSHHECLYKAGIVGTVLVAIGAIAAMLIFSVDTTFLRFNNVDELSIYSAEQKAILNNQIMKAEDARIRLQENILELREENNFVGTLTTSVTFMVDSAPKPNFAYTDDSLKVGTAFVDAWLRAQPTLPEGLQGIANFMETINPSYPYGRTVAAEQIFNELLHDGRPIIRLEPEHSVDIEIARLLEKVFFIERPFIKLADLIENNEDEINELQKQDDAIAEETKALEQLLRAYSQPPPDSSARSAALLLTRIAAVGLAVFLIQILISLTRYHARMADHYRSLQNAMQIANGDLFDLPNIAAITNANVDFGKVPTSVLEKAVEALKEGMSYRRHH